MSGGKHRHDDSSLTCRPLDTYTEILSFLQDPPPWRNLCKELTPHSKLKIKNIEINNRLTEPCLESPESFCHYNPEQDDIEYYDEKELPRTLVCHDMANGYHDDSFIDGTGNSDAYTFYNWAGIDIFCYFSHHLITIPPLGWINVGHAHGVKVIGTVITEWAEGVVFWDKILESESSYHNFASALVAIAKTLKFDGWLLNVENKISKPEVLVDFVKHLHSVLHQEIPHAELIWYDSVTVHGTLNWQNGLNDMNKAFFDACDGFFTNYSWTETDVERSALAAGDRIRDLYVGIDVWGRNFYGGGHFNTQQALKLVREYKCSAAIFAPAWTHEAVTSEPDNPNTIVLAEGRGPLFQFMVRDRALWGSLWPYLCTRLPCALPLHTSFCRGQGRKRWLQGEVLSPQPWYNLRHQQYQPNSALGPHGYLLSSAEHIDRLSKHAHLHSVKGILLRRDSFVSSRSQMLALQKAIIPADETNEIGGEVTRDGGAGSDSPKRKMKDVLRNLFHRKSQRRDAGSAGSTTSGTDESEGREAGPSEGARDEVSRGPSMVRASVNLRLGQARAAGLARYGLALVPDELECLEVHYEDAYTGGSCLRVNPSDPADRDHRHIRLLRCDVPCDHALVVCAVTKRVAGSEEQALTLRVSLVTAEGGERTAVLVPHHVPQGGGAVPPSGAFTSYALHPDSPQFRDLQRYLLLNENHFYMPVENSFGWNVMYYSVPAAGCRVRGVSCHTERGAGALLLGHVGLCARPPPPPAPSTE